jgi:CubicO group peptidase (beta-lactamase class C family)
MDFREPFRVGASCALVLMVGCGGAQRVPPAAAASSVTATHDTLARDLDAHISEIGKRWGPAYAFSGYVSVVRDGEVVLSKGYGKSDLQRGLVADADTRFRIGSITKQFTAVAVLQLVEQQKLRLDASIRSYLPQLPESFQAVTLHHLLSHTSGIYS